MAFTYQEYENSVNTNRNTADRPKVGFFKLGEGEEALVRFKVKTMDDLHFVALHKAVFGKKFEGLSNPYAGINCFNELGGNTDNCPFCRAVAAGHQVVDKASKKVFVEMMVAYKDKTTGAWTQPVPAVWERPAGFAREIASKLETYGDLTQTMLRMTRTGAGKDTRYILDYAVPTKYNPSIIPDDFSVFDNFDYSKHSYYKKSAEDMIEFVMTGLFKEAPRAEVAAETVTPATVTTATATPVAPAAIQNANQAPVSQVVEQPTYVSPTPVTAPAEPVMQRTAPVEQYAQPAAAAQTDRPTRTFTSFSF